MWWLAIESFILTVGDPFPEGENMNLRFISDVVNLLLKNTGGEAEGLILLFGVLQLLVREWWWRESENLV